MNSPSKFVSVLLGAAILLGAAMPARAIVPSGGGGYDSYSGPNGQSTRSATMFAGASLGGTLGAPTVTRFDDSSVGMGNGGMNLALIEGLLDGLAVEGVRARLNPRPGMCCVALRMARGGG